MTSKSGGTGWIRFRERNQSKPNQSKVTSPINHRRRYLFKHACSPQGFCITITLDYRLKWDNTTLIGVPRRTTMGVPNVLDTAALINWPIELLDGGYVVENQRLELSRVSPERMLSLEAANLIWKRPTIESINQATKISLDTGDLDGLQKLTFHFLHWLSMSRGTCTLMITGYRMYAVRLGLSGLPWRRLESQRPGIGSLNAKDVGE